MELRLDEKDINRLIKLHKTLKSKTDADKIKCLILWGKGWRWKQIQEALLISERYISELIRKYKTGNTDKVLKNNFKGHNNKMTVAQEKELCEFVDQNYVGNAKVACNFVDEHFGLKYTQAGMVITLHRLGFSFKKTRIVPGKLPDKQVQEDFVKKTNDIIDNLQEDEEAFFVDGSGLVHNVKMNYGWIKKGKDKNIRTNTGRKKMNINGAYNPVNNESVFIEQEGSESVNQHSNIELVTKIIGKNPKLKKLYLFMDNAKSNKGKIFKEYIENLKNVKVLPVYLPPYSPNLNLIERLWKYAKKELLSVYYEKFSDFEIKVIEYFENDLNTGMHKKRLSKFIGRKFHIIEAPS